MRYDNDAGLKFNTDDVQRCAYEWGMNCGPAAIAAIVGLSLDEVRPFLGDFEKKHYVIPKLMFEILNNLSVEWNLIKNSKEYPKYGLMRIQWEGPWTESGVPRRKRYRHTHWIGSRLRDNAWLEVFDINAMSHGGWISTGEWELQLVPWLLKQCEPEANGHFHSTHIIEVTNDRRR